MKFSIISYHKLTVSVLSVGGLAAVIYTDTLQALVMVVGATILTLIGKLSDCEFAYKYIYSFLMSVIFVDTAQLFSVHKIYSRIT